MRRTKAAISVYHHVFVDNSGLLLSGGNDKAFPAIAFRELAKIEGHRIVVGTLPLYSWGLSHGSSRPHCPGDPHAAPCVRNTTLNETVGLDNPEVS